MKVKFNKYVSKKIIALLTVFGILFSPMIVGNVFAANFLDKKPISISADDLSVIELEQGRIPKSLITQCLINNDVKKLITEVQESGYTISKDKNLKARIVNVPEVNAEIQQIMLPIYNNDIEVGGLIYILGPKATYVYTLIQENEGFIAEYVQDNNSEYVTFSNNGEIISSSMELSKEPSTVQSVTCKEVCTAICAGGVVGVLDKCVKSCRLLGPGAAWCSALCTIAGGIGCLAGCDRICSLL